MVYIDLDRRKGRPSNAVLFIFWLVLSVSSGIILRTKVLKALGYEQVCRWAVQKFVYVFERILKK